MSPAMTSDPGDNAVVVCPECSRPMWRHGTCGHGAVAPVYRRPAERVTGKPDPLGGDEYRRGEWYRGGKGPPRT